MYSMITMIVCFTRCAAVQRLRPPPGPGGGRFEPTNLEPTNLCAQNGPIRAVKCSG